MGKFSILALTPAGHDDPGLAIAATRAGALGVFNAESIADAVVIETGLARLQRFAKGAFGLYLPSAIDLAPLGLAERIEAGLGLLVVAADDFSRHQPLLQQFRHSGGRCYVEVTRWPLADEALLDEVDGIIVKGHESGGAVGEETAYILLQKVRAATRLPLIVRGGVGIHTSAACYVAGADGVALDNQLLLTRESPLSEPMRELCAQLVGNETVAIGNGSEQAFVRLLQRPHFRQVKSFSDQAPAQSYIELRTAAQRHYGWDDPVNQLLPLGQDVAHAAPLAKRYRTVGGIVRAIEQALVSHPRQALHDHALAEHAPLAESLGIRYPIVQGPMSRVSDTPAFSAEVARAGGLPMLAFALQKGEGLRRMLAQTKETLADLPWGIGLLGFAPAPLLEEQIEASRPYKPSYALIAGGRPDQAVAYEQEGIPSFLHVPSPRLLTMFIEQGARRFVFEGRECGGHIGPLSSFVLWESMIETLLSANLPANLLSEINILFAGGIHDRVSAAMVATMAAPLTALGVKVGVLMGSAYLFTREIVETGAILQTFQDEALACRETVTLESGPGHASRCSVTPFADHFFATRRAMIEKGASADEVRQVLDDLSLGRLRVAAKGEERSPDSGKLVHVDEARQRREGMYMIGQVATMHDGVCTIADLHREVSDEAMALIEACVEAQAGEAARMEESTPADIAIVGIATLLPQAENHRQFWENILAKVDAISEIPKHRWDWRLYFSEDRHEKDKIYSKWGGFLDDMLFDPVQFGMPPNAVKSVDPMQLMTLEVIRRALVDAGYDDREYDRERASVIIGASGGAGDVGLQYGVRSELPRFEGELDEEVARQLPEWSEDTFAGILLNVVSGRAANRFDFGGVNYTVDAACASSLAAIYQAVNELESGRSDLAIAGGVDTVQGPFGYMCFSKTQALSPTGRCRTFDAQADGISISEGIAMVVLKRLADAERDGDRIYAVIKGMGGSSDGRARGLTAPLPDGQLRALRRAYQKAGFTPATVGLFEAHGTGTVAGDTAELETTTRLLQEVGARPRQSVIGSVKTMIGHTKASAGVAGLVKAALALHKRILPPHANVVSPNGALKQSESPLYLLQEAAPWARRPDAPRRAGVSAFGFGGTNFHAVLEEYQDDFLDHAAAGGIEQWSAELLLWPLDDMDATRQQMAALIQAAEAGESAPLRDIAYTLASQFEPGAPALMVVAPAAGWLEQLRGCLAYLNDEGDLPHGVIDSRAIEAESGRVALLFPGQGSQYPDMCRELAIHFPEFVDLLDRANVLLADSSIDGWLSQYIYPPASYDDEDAAKAAAQRLTSTNVAQPALGVVEAALWRLLSRLGVKADMAAGHSYGEYVALHSAGVLGFDELLLASEARGRFMLEEGGGGDLGTMVAIQASRAEVESLIETFDDLTVANHNAPQQTIVSGGRESVENLIDQLRQRGIGATPLPVSAAFHSPFVAPAQQKLQRFLDQLEWHSPDFNVYANTLGRAHEADPEAIRAVMVEHLAKPVEFVAEVEAMYEAGARLFIELGPKRVLSGLVGKILADRPHRALAVDGGRAPAIEALLTIVAELLAAGQSLQLQELFRGRDCRRLKSLADNPRKVVVSPTAWWLNGSRARRWDEAPQIVGLTLEEARQRKAHSPQSPGSVAHPSLAKESRMSDDVPKPPLPPMPPSGAGREVLEAYFETMRQFLQTQERVMAAYLGKGGMPPLPRLPESPVSPPSQARTQGAPVAPAAIPETAPSPAAVQPAAAVETPTAAEPASPAPAAGSATGIDHDALTEQLLSVVEERTGYPRDMIGLEQDMEADLGIDSIKRVEIVGSFLKALPTELTAQLEQDREALNGKKTLAEIIDWVDAKRGAGAPASSSAEASTAAAEPAVAVSAEQISDLLLTIVEERTGYPRDMIGLEQDMEADLGIDSIKRVEIAGALLKQLPAPLVEKIDSQREALNGQKTLAGMVEWLTGMAQEEGSSLPFDQAGAGSTEAAEAVCLPRYCMVDHAEDASAYPLQPLAEGLYLITEDGVGLAQRVAEQIDALGGQSAILSRQVLEEPTALRQTIETLRAGRPVAGVLHLAALGIEPLSLQDDTAAWRHASDLCNKTLFRIAQIVADDLEAGGALIAASSLGGCFGRRHLGSIFSPQAGALGLVKSLAEEWPGLGPAKAIDLDPGQAPQQLAEQLLFELRLPGGRQEVGYPKGVRTVFATEAAPLAGALGRDIEADWVVLVTGGARGITAEVVQGLAAHGVTLILVGRSPEPEAEPAELAALKDEKALRDYFISQAKAKGEALKPVEIQRAVAAVERAREIRNNLADMRRAGARVECLVADVQESEQMAQLMAGIYQRYGRLDGIVHGAGVIEDKRLRDKLEASWDRVYDTKVNGLVALARQVRAESLKFLVIFASVAGRYGNSGQSDYATANETMNRLAWQLHSHWQGRVKVSCINWGPWAATRHGKGMVTAETEKKFAAKGVTLVTPEIGRAIFMDEITRAPLEQVEVIAGEGPWDRHEQQVGRFLVEPEVGEVATPLLRDARLADAGQGARRLSLTLDLTRHPYLFDHRIDGVAVVPAAVALEMMAEAAARLWPQRQVVEISDFRLFQGMRLTDSQLPIEIVATDVADGGATVTIGPAEGKGRPYYRASLLLADELPPAQPFAPLAVAATEVDRQRIYDDWLFHGPRFQTIQTIAGLDEKGARAEVSFTDVRRWLEDDDVGAWLFDPGVIDAGPQMALVWARATRDESALPNGIERVRRFAATPRGRCDMVFRLRQGLGEHQVLADVGFVDGEGRLIYLLEGLECTSSRDLNRIGGQNAADR